MTEVMQLGVAELGFSTANIRAHVPNSSSHAAQDVDESVPALGLNSWSLCL